VVIFFYFDIYLYIDQRVVQKSLKCVAVDQGV